MPRVRPLGRENPPQFASQAWGFIFLYKGEGFFLDFKPFFGTLAGKARSWVFLKNNPPPAA
jgi:hypothetical protein